MTTTTRAKKLELPLKLHRKARNFGAPAVATLCPADKEWLAGVILAKFFSEHALLCAFHCRIAILISMRGRNLRKIQGMSIEPGLAARKFA